MATSADSLAIQADAIHARYRRGFAGKNRATRDLAALDGLLSEMRAIAALLPATATAVRTTVDTWITLYADERAAIARVQLGGADAVTAWRLVEWNEATFQRYQRGYAGKSRTTRDGWLLAEMAERQARWAAQLAPLAARLHDGPLDEQLTELKRNVELYEAEAKAIPAARASLPLADYARTLATLANGQFRLYRLHFAEKSRLSRRPPLLRRILAGLQDIEREMAAVRDQGITTPSHLDNLGKVTERIRHHRGEMTAIENARRNASASELAGALGDDANGVFASYREQFAQRPRSAVDAGTLGELCERLHEIAAAMAELQDLRSMDTNDRNIGIVLETVRAWEREIRAIEKAKAAS